MKQLTEEKKETENQPKNGSTFESMNINVGEIFPKKK